MFDDNGIAYLFDDRDHGRGLFDETNWADSAPEVGARLLRLTVLDGDLVDVDRTALEGGSYAEHRRRERARERALAGGAPSWPRHESELAFLADAVGGWSVLDALTADPLPDLPFEVAGLEPEVAQRVTAAVSTVSDAVARLRSPELAAAFRAAVAAVLRRDPRYLARSVSDVFALAHVARLVVVANSPGSSDASSRPAGIATGLRRELSLASTPNGREGLLLDLLEAGTQAWWSPNRTRPAELDRRCVIGPAYLVATTRASMIRLRDRALAERVAYAKLVGERGVCRACGRAEGMAPTG